MTREPDSVNRRAPQDQLRTPARSGGDRLSVLVVALALIGAVFCAGLLLFVRFAHWAGTHPFAGTLLIVLAVPVLYVALRAMPRRREMRRAARAGMAQADRELGCVQPVRRARCEQSSQTTRPHPACGPRVRCTTG
ncbi:hypothetical protein [Streptomyces sp. NPDC058247]|uniref:hypothetical protein n=1 Tax=Streptomyces sp. NPDC058247 TaxID=3346401 RepID=UPI0036E9FA85